MSLYTFIADYEGGIYISQVTAPNPKSAIFIWAQNLEVEAIPNVGEKSRWNLIQQLRRQERHNFLYVPLKDLINVWRVAVLVRETTMLINFVETNS